MTSTISNTQLRHYLALACPECDLLDTLFPHSPCCSLCSSQRPETLPTQVRGKHTVTTLISDLALCHSEHNIPSLPHKPLPRTKLAKAKSMRTVAAVKAWRCR